MYRGLPPSSGSIRRRSRLTSVSTLRTVTKRWLPQILAREPVSAEDDAGVRGQDIEKTEFLFRQIDAAVLDADVTPGRIHLDVSVGDERRGLAGSAPFRRRAGRARAMNRGTRARRKLAGPERFHQEIVGAVLDFGQRRRLGISRRDDDNRDVTVQGVLPQRPAHLQSGDVGRAQIHEDQVERLRLRLRQRRRSVGGGLTRIPIESQTCGNQLAESSFVLDNQDAFAGGGEMSDQSVCAGCRDRRASVQGTRQHLVSLPSAGRPAEGTAAIGASPVRDRQRKCKGQRAKGKGQRAK